MKILYKLFVNSFIFLLLLLSITFFGIDYYFSNFKNEIFTSSVLKQYPSNHYKIFISMCLILFVFDLKFKIFRKFILLVKKLDHRLLYIISIKIILILVLFDIVFFRRTLLFALFSPYLIYFFFRVHFSKKIKKKIFFYFCIFGFVVAMFPGYYLHPFFSGIPGWGVNLLKEKYLSENRMYIKIYADYENQSIEEYFSHALFNPITHFGRPLLNFQKRLIWETHYKKKIDISDYKKKICKTMIDIYSDAYPYLKKGIFPYQKNFYNFSYPTHNMSYVYESYKNIHPEKINKISFLQTHIKIDTFEEKIFRFKQEEIFSCKYDKY